MSWLEDKIAKIKDMAEGAGKGALLVAGAEVAHLKSSASSAPSAVGAAGAAATSFAHEVAASKIGHRGEQAGKWAWNTLGQDYVDDAKYLWGTHLFDFTRDEIGAFHQNFWGALGSLPMNLVHEEIKLDKARTDFEMNALLHPVTTFKSVFGQVSSFVRSHEGQRLMFDLVTLIPIGKVVGVVGKLGIKLFEAVGLKGLVKFGAKTAEKFGVKGLVSLGEKFSQKLESGLQKSAFGKKIVSSATNLAQGEKVRKWTVSLISKWANRRQVKGALEQLGETAGSEIIGVSLKFMKFIGRFPLGEDGFIVAGWIAEKIGGGLGKDIATNFATRFVRHLTHTAKPDIGLVKKLFVGGRAASSKLLPPSTQPTIGATRRVMSGVSPMMPATGPSSIAHRSASNCIWRPPFSAERPPGWASSRAASR